MEKYGVDESENEKDLEDLLEKKAEDSEFLKKLKKEKEREEENERED